MDEIGIDGPFPYAPADCDHEYVDVITTRDWHICCGCGSAFDRITPIPGLG